VVSVVAAAGGSSRREAAGPAGGGCSYSGKTAGLPPTALVLECQERLSRLSVD
jgi:hypothetical protein